MSQAAVFMTCQIPLKSGLPSGVRGNVLVGVWALEIGTAKRRTIERAVAEAGRRYGMAAVLYTRWVCGRQGDALPEPLDGRLGCRNCAADGLCDSWIDLPRGQLEDFLLVTGAERRDLVDVALGVVVKVAGLGINPAHGTNHLRPEHDVVDRHDFQQQLDSRIVIDARV